MQAGEGESTQTKESKRITLKSAQIKKKKRNIYKIIPRA
jgi:hypothetical protein